MAAKEKNRKKQWKISIRLRRKREGRRSYFVHSHEGWRTQHHDASSE